MENKIIHYKIKIADEEAIRSHLELCDEGFSPPLSQKVNIKEYAKKIFERAVTFEAWKNNLVAGLIAAYFSDTASRKAFITNVSVIKKCLGQGIASELMKMCIHYAKQNDFDEIALEVGKNNNTAIALYEKFGFSVEGNMGDNLKMKLKITNQI